MFPSFPSYKEGSGGRGQIEPGPPVMEPLDGTEQQSTSELHIYLELPRPQALIKKFHASHYMKVYMK
jgi:hypothetical protein